MFEPKKLNLKVFKFHDSNDTLYKWFCFAND